VVERSLRIIRRIKEEKAREMQNKNLGKIPTSS
jgi:hypothetical protein